MEIPIAQVAAITVAGLVAGCATNDHYVIASTGTTIGLEISQNQATQAPQAKLGYNRAELALVPTNRENCIKGQDGNIQCSNSQDGNGAADATDVIMELRYGGFSLTGSGGIYQRLAIGGKAVSQPGAAFMFAKDQDGDLTENATGALESVLSAEQLAKAREMAATKVAQDDEKIELVLSKVTTNGSLDKSALATAVDGVDGISGSIKKRIKSYNTLDELREGLEVRDNVALDMLFEGLK